MTKLSHLQWNFFCINKDFRKSFFPRNSKKSFIKKNTGTQFVRFLFIEYARSIADLHF